MQIYNVVTKYPN